MVTHQNLNVAIDKSTNIHAAFNHRQLMFARTLDIKNGEKRKLVPFSDLNNAVGLNNILFTENTYM